MKKEKQPDVQICVPLKEGVPVYINLVRLYLEALQKGWEPLSFCMGKNVFSRWKNEVKRVPARFINETFIFRDQFQMNPKPVKLPIKKFKTKETTEEFQHSLVQLLCIKGKGVSHEVTDIGSVSASGKINLG